MFFCVAALTRRMLPVYVGSVLLLIGYLAAQGLLRDIDNKTLAVAARSVRRRSPISQLTEYWSISERNTRLVPLEGVLLWNRLLWLAIAGAVIAFCSYRFAFTQRPGRGSAEEPARGRGRRRGTGAGAPSPPRRAVDVGAASAAWRLLPRMVWLNFRETVKNVYFGVIALAGVLFCVATSTTAGSIFGTDDLAGHLADAGARVRHVRRLHAGDHHVLRGRARVARARARGSTRSTTRCRSRRGCRSSPSCSR